MITSASAYECVDVTGLSSFITGEVMPKRDNNGDGSWRAKRYEDLLFLQEAYLERRAVCDDATFPVDVSTPPKPRIINNLYFNNAVSSLGAMVLQSGMPSYRIEYIDADKSPTFNFADTNQTTIRDVLLSLGWNFTDDARTVSGRKLTADDVRHAFWRTKKLKRSLYRVPLESIYTCTYTFSYAGGTQDGYSYSETGDWNGLLYATNMETVLLESSVNVRVSFTGKSVAQPRWMARASSGKSQRWLYLCKVTHSVRGSVNSETKIKIVSRVMPNANPISNMALLTSQFASACGFPYNSSPYYSQNDTYRYEVIDAAMIVEHDFPAEIDSLNWNWQPT